MHSASLTRVRNEHDGNSQADTNSSAGTDDQEDESRGSDVSQQAENSRQPPVTIHASKRAKTGVDALSCHAAAAQAGPSTAAQACLSATEAESQRCQWLLHKDSDRFQGWLSTTVHAH
ncbi:hypothetical protein WJX82_003383 [Trebouxia sp. C0006]